MNIDLFKKIFYLGLYTAQNTARSVSK